MKSSLAEQILQKINEEHLRPTPRWQFIMRETAVWTAVSLTVLFAATSIGHASYRFMAGDVRALFAAGVPWYQLLLVIGWTGAFVCLFLLVLYEVRCTKRGYRFSLVAISGAGSLVIVGIAGVIYSVGFVHIAERHMARMMPTYLDTGSAREQFWSSPNEGRLLGYVIATQTRNDEASFFDIEYPVTHAESRASSSDTEAPRSESKRFVHVKDRMGHEWTVLLDQTLSDSINLGEVSSSSFLLFVGTRAQEELFSACGMALYTHSFSDTGEYAERPFNGHERLVGAVRTKKCAPVHTTLWR